MGASEVRASSYRVVVLAAFMLAIAANQLLWISFAPITGVAAAFYGVSDLAIGLLSLVFMVVFILVSLPASWILDTYGIRIGVGIGVALTAGFGLLRGLMAHDYAWVLAAQIGIAVGQPFILNAIAKLAGRWFPLRERATAAGLGSLAMYAGIFIGLAVTPQLVLRTSLPVTLLAYGIAGFGVVTDQRVPHGPPSHHARNCLSRLGHLVQVLLVGLGRRARPAHGLLDYADLRLGRRNGRAVHLEADIGQ